MKRKISRIMIHHEEASGKCSATWSHILIIPAGSESLLQNACSSYFFFLISCDVPVRKHTNELCSCVNKQQRCHNSAFDRYFLLLVIQYILPKVCNQVNNAIRLYLEPKKKKTAFYINSSTSKESTNDRANTLSNSRIRGFIQPNSLQADCQ